jgi:HK97 family phage major capsid protein
MHVSEIAADQALRHLRQADELLTVAASIKEAKSEDARLRRMITDEYREQDGFRAIAEGRSLEREAPRVAAVSDALARSYGATPRPGGFFVPITTRVLTAGVAGDGGNLVGAELQFFVDAYREGSLLRALRVQELDARANAGGATITTKTTSYWLTNETTQITASQAVFGTLTTAPKTVGAYAEASRQFVLQIGSDGLRMVYRELAGALSEAADTALLGGTAANGQPRGLANVSGIGSIAGATFSLAKAAEMLKTIEAAQGVRDRSRVAWVCAPAVFELLVKREAASGNGFLIQDGRMLGIPVFSTASAPASWLALGDWSAVTLVGYSPLELATNPYAASVAGYQAGIIGIRAMLSLDFAWTKPAAFCVATSVG